VTFTYRSQLAAHPTSADVTFALPATEVVRAGTIATVDLWGIRRCHQGLFSCGHRPADLSWGDARTGDRYAMTAIALMMRPTDNGWAVCLSNGQRTLPGLTSAASARHKTFETQRLQQADSLAFSTMRVGDVCWSRLGADRPGNRGADVEYRQAVRIPLSAVRPIAVHPTKVDAPCIRLDFNVASGE
jgi:hypothetical protein